MKFSRRLIPVVKNKYFISIVLFAVWMRFFDVKDWSLIMARRDKLSDLQKSEARFNSLIRETEGQLYLLKTNAETIEKYARENYLMKKDNEDLFIVHASSR
jgi:cell division protein FtsB